MAKRQLTPDEMTIRLRLTEQLAERDRRIQDITTKNAQMAAAYGDAIRLAEEVMMLADRMAAWLDNGDPMTRQLQKIDCVRLSQFARGVFGKLAQVSR